MPRSKRESNQRLEILKSGNIKPHGWHLEMDEFLEDRNAEGVRHCIEQSGFKLREYFENEIKSDLNLELEKVEEHGIGIETDMIKYTISKMSEIAELLGEKKLLRSVMQKLRDGLWKHTKWKYLEKDHQIKKIGSYDAHKLQDIIRLFITLGEVDRVNFLLMQYMKSRKEEFGDIHEILLNTPELREGNEHIREMWKWYKKEEISKKELYELFVQELEGVLKQNPPKLD